MTSRFEIVDEEYTEELKDEQKWEQEENHTVPEERFQKAAERKKLPSKFRRLRKRCPRPETAAVLCIQKFSNFALFVIEK